MKAEELQDWHIESKGTKHASLPASVLRKWVQQVTVDAPADIQPVIIHVPNGAGDDAGKWTAIIPITPKVVFAKFVMQLDAIYTAKVDSSYNFIEIIDLAESMDWLQNVIDDMACSRPINGEKPYHSRDRIIVAKVPDAYPVLAMRSYIWIRAAKQLCNL